MKATSRIGRTESAAASHWLTYFAHVHGRLPRKTTSARDWLALRYIARVDALGHEHRACAIIEAIVRAPIKGDSLFARYAAYWALLEGRRLTQHFARDVRACIRGAA